MFVEKEYPLPVDGDEAVRLGIPVGEWQRLLGLVKCKEEK